MKHENCYLIIVEIQSFSDNEVEHVFHGMLGISLFGKLHICTSWHAFVIYFEFSLEWGQTSGYIGAIDK